MALLIDSSHNSKSSSKSRAYRTTTSPSRGNTQASAYVAGRSGGFEVRSGTSPSPPSSPDASPPLSATSNRPLVVKARKRSGDAAHHITEESERLFCETLRAVFLVEKDAAVQNSLVVDARNSNSSNATTAGSRSRGAVEIPPRQLQHTILKHDLPTPSPSPDERRYQHPSGLVREYVEVWDYSGGARFRGFVAEKDGERALFVFFDKEVVGKDLKPGVVALLELAGTSSFDCSQLVICVDRTAGKEESEDVTRDLGWVGFELMMLDTWAGESGCISDRWYFLGMDV